MQTIVLVVLALVLPAAGRASDANLDPSFGSFGWTSVDATPGPDPGEGVAVQADGRIVVVGPGFTVRRFTATGSLDASFGVGGTVTTDAGNRGVAHAVALQADGGIVVVGGGEASPGNPSFVAVRYASDGTLDASFGVGGIAYVDIAVDASFETANAVMVQPDLRLVLAGDRSAAFPAPTTIRVVRLLSDGSPDPSFGTGGIAAVDVAGQATHAQDAVLQPDGKIVIGGSTFDPDSGTEILVLRLTGDGSLDPTFGSGGIRTESSTGGQAASAIAVQPLDGKIVVGGLVSGFPSSSEFVVRYLSDGSPDPSFGTGGRAETSFGPFMSSAISDMVLLPDGRIELFGSVGRVGIGSDTALVRFNADGSPDTTLAPAGRTRVMIGPGRSGATAGARQADGKIVVTGYRADLPPSANTPVPADTALLVARFGGSCGNAFVDPGEQCDDGNADGLDCCSVGCGYDSPGARCETADGTVCTRDRCDGAGTCAVGGPWPASECVAVTRPDHASLKVTNKSPDGLDKLSWKWSQGPVIDGIGFGQPTVHTAYSLCVFGGTTLAAESDIPPGESLRDGWESRRNGPSVSLRRDPLTTPGGIGRAMLAPYTGRPNSMFFRGSKITVSGKGPLLGPPAIPLATPVTVQLVSPEGECFTATYATPQVNAAGQFKAKGQ